MHGRCNQEFRKCGSMEKIKKWLADNSPGSGYGDGYGSGDGYGDGDGYGSGYGDGYGSGYGDGYGDGYGSGSGSGSGSGIKEFDGQAVFRVDGVNTLINHVHGAMAKGYILESDFSLVPCYIAKGNGYFAHGKTAKEAVDALHSKIFENMNPDEAIVAFMDKFKPGEKYPGTEFFEWHHYLTGSCLMGRESFVRSHDLNLEDKITVDEFIALCENDYGGEIIRQLKERWQS